jgi:DNA-binding HxlR family transcriptional regulator
MFDPWTGTVRRIQSRALGRTLRRMETAGLVDQVEERTFPQSVVYSLTPAARGSADPGAASDRLGGREPRSDRTTAESAGRAVAGY